MAFCSTILAILLWNSITYAQEMPSSKCVWQGKWFTDASRTKGGNIRWQITEIQECCGLWALNLKGTMKDEYGNAVISGSCAEGQCNVRTVYTTGSLKGASYDYAGDILWQQPLDKMKALSNGVWKESNGKSSGVFNIHSMSCRR